MPRLRPDSRIAVLGGGGFLGRHVVRALRTRGIAPIVPRTADGWDFRDAGNASRFFEQVRPGIAINCAARQGGLAYQRQCPADIYRDNLLMGLNTLHAAQRAEVGRYVNVVAACSYPGYADGMLTEDDYWSGPLHDSVVAYGFARKAQVVQGTLYRRQHGFDSIHLLMTNLYGPGEHFHPDRSHGLAALLRKFVEAKRDGAPHVVVWGTGRPIREWLFVEDAAEAIVLAADRYEDEAPLNVSVGDGLTIAALAALIREVVGYEGGIVYDPEKPDGALVKTFANDRIREALGWAPRTPIREGISRTLDWLKAHWDEATAERV